jgi:multiple sugar transport system ATP-binding protein
MASITYDGITKRYPDGTPAVVDLDLSIRDGEFLVLVGPSGCGKTTALRMAAGLEEISGGRLTIGDRVVNDVAPAARDIAMVFQNYALYPHMTVRENIAFPLTCQGLSKPEITERVDRAAESLGLTEYLHRKPKALSGGQRQRVAMGRAIVRKPQAFLMDEPLSNLDAKLRGQMRAEIRALQREYGTTTLYVTHDQVEAMTMGDRIAVLRKGLLQQLGTPEELYDAPANLFVAGFIGSPPMNIIKATVVRGSELVVGSQRFALPAGALDGFPSLAAGTAVPVALGLRPESLHDGATADPSWPRLVADVELVENIPPEKLVHVRVDAEPVVTDAILEIARDVDAAAVDELRSLGTGSVLNARLPGATAIREGTRVEFALSPSALHFFDPVTGVALTRTPRRVAA